MNGRYLGPGGKGNEDRRFLRNSTYTMDEIREVMKRCEKVKSI
jgi:hypothetical protein